MTTTPREHLVAFTPEKLRAIREGRASQHRWAPERQPEHIGVNLWATPRCVFIPESELADYLASGRDRDIRCPYQPGDVLVAGKRWRDETGRRHTSYRNATRLTVLAVRAERLQEISEEDAIAEGFPGENLYRHPSLGWTTDDGMLASEQFAEDWDARHADRPDHQWAANPCVFPVELELREDGR